MIQRRTCPFVSEPADFPASSLPTRRDILKFVQFLRLNTVTKLSNVIDNHNMIEEIRFSIIIR